MAQGTTMTDSSSTGVGEQFRRASAWPPFVAIGLAISEVGVVLNLVPVSIGGILLFGGSLAGILVDASITESPWPSLGAIGVVFGALGGVMWASQLQQYTLSRLFAVANTNAIAMRGEAVVAAGALLFVGAVIGIVFKPTLTDY